MRRTLGYSHGAWRAFGWVFGPRMRLGIHALRMTGLPRHVPVHMPLLLVSNHVSWWDGFLLRPLQVALRPGDELRVVMLEQELVRRPFLRLLGGVGITPGSPASLRSFLRELRARRASDPSLTVLFFPQGRIWPSHRRPLGFLEGIRAVGRALAPATILPVGLHLEPGRHPAPTAYLSVGEPSPVGAAGPDPGLLEAQVQAQLDRTRAFLATHGEDAETLWPEPFEALPSIPLPMETSA